MDTFNAGTLGTTPLIYHVTVHGPVFATATVGGKPYALSRRRSTFGRDGLNLVALKDMTEGKATHAGALLASRRTSSGSPSTGPTSSRKETAYFSSGYLPKRARGLDRRLPTLGNGQVRVEGLPHVEASIRTTSPVPTGCCSTGTTARRPGFMHGDDEPYGSVQRVEMFNQCPASRRRSRTTSAS